MRLGALAVLLFAERSLLSASVHAWFGAASPGLGEAMMLGHSWRFHFGMTFAALLIVLAATRGDERLALVNRAVQTAGLRYSWAAVHVAAVAGLAILEFCYTSGTPSSLQSVFAMLAGGFAVLAAAAGLAALAPAALWWQAARALGPLWLYAAAAAMAAVLATQWSERLWAPTASLTFALVRLVLLPLLPTLHSDSAAKILSTDSFGVQIADVCSGLEGAGLMVVFCTVLLIVFRREFSFPRALLIIPIALALIFLLNVVRIASLLLIGHAGYADIAMQGFHSNAGWIAFNLAAGLVAYASRRIGWFNRPTSHPSPLAAGNPTAVYLLPLLVILGAGMLAGALSSGFDLFYPLRLLAGAIALLWSWPRLAALDWRISWRGPALGVAVFLVWIGAARQLTHPQSAPAVLHDMPDWMRNGWLAARILAAVVTVPAAEELAYRGFLLRRLVAEDFESVRFSTVGLWPVIFSAMIFGAGHGSLWPAGIVAGVAYALLLRRTGRLGESIAAHATTNALLAAYVLLAGQWQLW